MAKVQTTLKWQGPQVEDAMRSAAAEGLLIAAEYILGEANHTVPFLVGIMEHSGVATVDEQRLAAAVSYDTPYAVRQHEDLTLRHPNGRRAKWLELTMSERGQKVIDLIGTQVRRRVGA